MSENPLAVITDDLGPKHLQAMLLLMSGRTQKEVAEEVGVDPRTIRSWKNQEDFEAMQEFLAHLYLDRSVGELVRYQFSFMGILEDIAQDTDESTEDRIQASVEGLSHLQNVQSHSTKITPEWIANLIGSLNQQPDQTEETGRLKELYNALSPEERERLWSIIQDAGDPE